MKGGELMDAAPLLDWVGRHPDVLEGWYAEKAGEHAAVMRRINHLRAGSRLTFGTADEICCLLGVHMSEVFGERYWSARCDEWRRSAVARERREAA